MKFFNSKEFYIVAMVVDNTIASLIDWYFVKVTLLDFLLIVSESCITVIEIFLVKREEEVV